VEQTKENQAFRGEYMAWGLAEQDAEKRGYKAGVTDGIEQGIAQGIEQGMEQGIAQGMEQKAFETAQNLLAMDLSLDNIAKATGLSLETLEKLVVQENASNK
jgi:predicted transposase/invertase (TIGR01784 family)